VGLFGPIVMGTEERYTHTHTHMYIYIYIYIYLFIYIYKVQNKWKYLKVGQFGHDGVLNLEFIHRLVLLS